MAKNKVKAPVAAKRTNKAQIARIVLGVLVVLNLIVAGLVLYPPWGSAESLEQDLVQLQAQVRQSKMRLEESRRNVAAVEKGRGAADEFLNKYFVTRRTIPSTMLTELDQIAQRTGIKDRGNSFSLDLIDGSETLGMVTITANFEGTYRNLFNFVQEIDKSSSLLIIESLNAAPQQGSNILTVSIKMQAFVREDEPLQVASQEAQQ
jgi:Tfp pilus assembly protein PilO